jgi:hypothetical protein
MEVEPDLVLGYARLHHPGFGALTYGDGGARLILPIGRVKGAR